MFISSLSWETPEAAIAVSWDDISRDISLLAFSFPLFLLNFLCSERGSVGMSQALGRSSPLCVPSLCTLAAHPCQNCTLHFPARRQKWGKKKGELKFSPKCTSSHQGQKILPSLCVSSCWEISFATQKLKITPSVNWLLQSFCRAGIVAGTGSCPRGFPRNFSHPVQGFQFLFPLSDL